MPTAHFSKNLFVSLFNITINIIRILDTEAFSCCYIPPRNKQMAHKWADPLCVQKQCASVYLPILGGLP